MPRVQSTIQALGFDQFNRRSGVVSSDPATQTDDGLINDVNILNTVKTPDITEQIPLSIIDQYIPDGAISGNKLNTYDTGNAGVTSVGTFDDDIRLWAGASFKDRAFAPFQVHRDGSVTMTDALITGKVLTTFTAGETLVPGEIGYFKTSDSRVYKALADGADFEHIDNLVGVVYKGASAGNDVQIQLFLGAIADYTGLTTGAVYFLDDTTPGAISKTAGFYKVKIGVALSATELLLDKDVIFDLFGGTGTDGALTVSAGTTTLVAGQVYNYSSISITGGTLAFSGSNEPVIINCSGDCTMTGGTIELRYRNTNQIFVQSNKGTQLRSGSAPGTLAPNIGGTGGVGGAGSGGDGGTSTTASATPGVGGAGGAAGSGDGGDGEGGNSTVGGGGGGGGGGTGVVGTAGATTATLNGGSGGIGGNVHGSGGGGGGGYDTGTGGTGGYAWANGNGQGGKGGASGANGGNGGRGGRGWGGANCGNGGWGYVNGGAGGNGGATTGSRGGNGGAGLTGTGGVGGTGGTGGIAGHGGTGGNGSNGGAGGVGGSSTAGGGAGRGGDGGNGGDGGSGSTCLLLYVRGNMDVNGVTVNGHGGNGANGGNGGSGGGSVGDIGGSGGDGGDGGDGTDVAILCLGTYTSGATINNTGGTAGSGGAADTASPTPGIPGDDGDVGENGRQYVGQLINA